MIKALQVSVDDYLNLAANLPTDSFIAYNRLAAAVCMVSASIKEAESMNLSRVEILKVLEPLRLLFNQSPFINRVQNWLRGYHGDFETIEYICNNSVKAIPNTPAFYLEQQALRTIAAQQHRNKVQWQAQFIAETAISQNQARILSIACGSCRDIRSIQNLIKNTDTQFFLNDADPDALDFSLSHLTDLASRITVLAGNVFKSIRNFSKYQPFNLIIAGGLFDYLSDRQIEFLLPKLVALLETGGSVIFTNIAPENPDRIWMEYLADWHLIERSEADIYRLVASTKESHDLDINIERDPSGLTLLVKLTTLAQI